MARQIAAIAGMIAPAPADHGHACPRLRVLPEIRRRDVADGGERALLVGVPDGDQAGIGQHGGELALDAVLLFAHAPAAAHVDLRIILVGDGIPAS